MARPAHPIGLSGPIAHHARLPFTTSNGRVRRSMLAIRRVDPAAAFGLCTVGVFVLAAILAPVIEPHDPLAQDISLRLKSPGFIDPHSGARFWLGPIYSAPT